MLIAPANKLALTRLRAAALDRSPVVGLTHRFYKYPARFSPQFAAAAIESFSQPGDVVLDPYMGGGTTVLEAYARGRRAVGCDINSLAVFVAKAKSTLLTRQEVVEIKHWAAAVVPRLSYHTDRSDVAHVICPTRTYNLNLPRARPAKKLIALALAAISSLSTVDAQDFARCALLNVSQWALNGRRRSPSLQEFRERLTATTLDMLNAMSLLDLAISSGEEMHRPVLIHDSAENLQRHSPLSERGNLADLVVTSPPYPGVHILYHRWQVDGRRETPAPYWIANQLDGQGAAHYNFGGRKQVTLDDYFSMSLRTMKAVRAAMRGGATIVQMVAFSEPSSQVRRYLETMRAAGFSEARDLAGRLARTWRDVPGRAWHATLNGRSASSRELVLVHVAA